MHGNVVVGMFHVFIVSQVNINCNGNVVVGMFHVFIVSQVNINCNGNVVVGIWRSKTAATFPNGDFA